MADPDDEPGDGLLDVDGGPEMTADEEYRQECVPEPYAFADVVLTAAGIEGEEYGQWAAKLGDVGEWEAYRAFADEVTKAHPDEANDIAEATDDLWG